MDLIDCSRKFFCVSVFNEVWILMNHDRTNGLTAGLGKSKSIFCFDDISYFCSKRRLWIPKIYIRTMNMKSMQKQKKKQKKKKKKT